MWGKHGNGRHMPEEIRAYEELQSQGRGKGLSNEKVTVSSGWGGVSLGLRHG